MDNMGKQKFKKGLEELGYKISDIDENRLSIKHKITDGRFKNQEIEVGFEVPADFELNPPTGPHIKPRLLPIRPDGPDHNTRAHESENFGTEWEYLSRPIPNWPAKRTVKSYLKYIIHLLNTL